MEFANKLNDIYGIKTELKSVLIPNDIPEDELSEFETYPDHIKSLYAEGNAFDIQWKLLKDDYFEHETTKQVKYDSGDSYNEYVTELYEKYKYRFSDDDYIEGDYVSYKRQPVMIADTTDRLEFTFYVNNPNGSHVNDVLFKRYFDNGILYNLYNNYAALDGYYYLIQSMQKPANKVIKLLDLDTAKDGLGDRIIRYVKNKDLIYEKVLYRDVDSTKILDIRWQANEVNWYASDKLNHFCINDNNFNVGVFRLYDAPNAAIYGNVGWNIKEIELDGCNLRYDSNIMFYNGKIEKITFRSPISFVNAMDISYISISNCSNLTEIYGLDYINLTDKYFMFSFYEKNIVRCKIDNFCVPEKYYDYCYPKYSDVLDENDLIYTFTNAIDRGWIQQLSLNKIHYDILKERGIINTLQEKGFTISTY